MLGLQGGWLAVYAENSSDYADADVSKFFADPITASCRMPCKKGKDIGRNRLHPTGRMQDLICESETQTCRYMDYCPFAAWNTRNFKLEYLESAPDNVSSCEKSQTFQAKHFFSETIVIFHKMTLTFFYVQQFFPLTFTSIN